MPPVSAVSRDRVRHRTRNLPNPCRTPATSSRANHTIRIRSDAAVALPEEVRHEFPSDVDQRKLHRGSCRTGVRSSQCGPRSAEHRNGRSGRPRKRLRSVCGRRRASECRNPVALESSRREQRGSQCRRTGRGRSRDRHRGVQRPITSAGRHVRPLVDRQPAGARSHHARGARGYLEEGGHLRRRLGEAQTLGAAGTGGLHQLLSGSGVRGQVGRKSGGRVRPDWSQHVLRAAPTPSGPLRR